MVDVLLIADDLTGAADAGVMFCSSYQPVLLLTGSATEASLAHGTAPAAVLAVSTESRALSPEAAYNCLRSCLAEWQPTLMPRRLFKKIDSSLRGNIGAEVDAIIEHTEATVSFIAAAFPTLGRTTRNGVHAIHGLPVAETELYHDPVTPVRDSNLPAVVAAQSRLRVGHINLDYLELPLHKLQKKLEELRTTGCVHITFDATDDEHLDILVALANACGENVVLVGTAGLATAAARAWRPSAIVQSEPLQATVVGSPLYVCGTAAARTRQQIEALAADTDCALINLTADFLADPALGGKRLREAEQIWQKYPGRPIALIVAKEERASCVQPSLWPPEQVARGLAELAQSLVAKQRPSALFCCGGDTAGAVLRVLGAWGSELKRTVRPGTVLGVMRGGSLDGLPLATKPGSFGDSSDLVALHNFWTGKGKVKCLP